MFNISKIHILLCSPLYYPAIGESAAKNYIERYPHACWRRNRQVHGEISMLSRQSILTLSEQV